MPSLALPSHAPVTFSSTFRSGHDIHSRGLVKLATDQGSLRPVSIVADPVIPQSVGKRAGAKRSLQNPSTIAGRSASSLAGRIQLVQTPDEEYLAKISIGTPPQDVYLELDTGSEQFWLSSPSVPGATSTTKHMMPTFNPLASSSWQESNIPFEMVYQDMSSSKGKSGHDVISFGGLRLTAQQVGVGTQVTQRWQDSRSNGCLGLTRGGVFATNLARSVPNAVLTLRLIKDKGGEIIVGAVDESYLKGKLSYSPIVADGSGWWLMKYTAVKIGSIVIQSAKDATAIPDTGSVLVYLPSAMTSVLYKGIPGSRKINNEWCVPTGSKYPPVEIQIGGVFYQVPNSQAQMSMLDRHDGMKLGAFQESKAGFEILGALFLKSALVVLDIKQARVGLARRTDVVYDS